MDIDKAPVYFTPDTFQLRKELRLKKAKKLRKAIKKWNSRVKKDPSHIKFRDGVEKCVNFLSSFPQGNKMTNMNTLTVFSSTESEEGLGFEEAKDACLSSTTESESEDSFAIVFSDTKRKQLHKVKQTKEIKKKRACSSRMSTLPYESDSDSSFDVCFEKDGDDSNDSFDNNDDLSDSDSLTLNSNKETKATFSGYNVTKINDGWPTDCVDMESVDVCDGVGFSGPKRPRKKVWFDSGAPKVHTIVAWAYAYRQARIGPWEMCARDGERFRKRIKDTSGCLDWIFGSEHRSKIFFQRFKPLLMEQTEDKTPGFEDEVDM